MLSSSVGGWELWVELDTADAGAVASDGHSHVASLTPVSVPAVLHDPVLSAVLGAVANENDGVVDVGAAGRAVEDTAGVGHEGYVVGLDGDGDRLLLEGGLQL